MTYFGYSSTVLNGPPRNGPPKRVKLIKIGVYIANSVCDCAYIRTSALHTHACIPFQSSTEWSLSTI